MLQARPQIQHAAAAPARLSVAVIAALFGILIVYAAGLSHPDTLHNAAHDSRHSLAFPCH